MMFLSVDLSNYYNHIIYKNEEIELNEAFHKKTVYGLPHVNNILITDKKRESIKAFDVEFRCACENSIFDNLMCDGQILEVSDTPIRSIAFLGFSEMGTVCDEVKLHTDDHEITVPLIMKTFHSDKFKGIDNVGKNAECKLALYLNGTDGQKHGVFFWRVQFSQQYSLKSIELPANCAVHLFSITLST